MGEKASQGVAMGGEAGAVSAISAVGVTGALLAHTIGTRFVYAGNGLIGVNQS